jgi:predicted glycoside hydrolase/deacetylase ChbG (UPF0249 family)
MPERETIPQRDPPDRERGRPRLLGADQPRHPRSAPARDRHEPRFYGAAAIGVERLLEILDTLPEGDSELGCHPGYAKALRSTYTVERETEIATLTDPGVRHRVQALGMELILWDAL